MNGRMRKEVWRKTTNERKKMKIMRMALRNITFVQNRNIGIVRGYHIYPTKFDDSEKYKSDDSDEIR